MSEQPAVRSMSGRIRSQIESVGHAAGTLILWAEGTVRFVGGAAYLIKDAAVSLLRGLFVPGVRLGGSALAEQMVRVGVRSIPIVSLVLIFIGIILALQMAPVLESYGQLERTADIVAIAIFRELGPLIAAIVLSGFAGASIAAEIGSMVEAEEIKALRAHALNPVHFLVMPRIVATILMLTGLAVIADIVGVLGGFFTAVFILDLPWETYLDYTINALLLRDFITGLVKAGVFGLLISLIACYEGLSVTGGAVGVGRATTATVVKSIVALIGIDCVFTAIFYAFGI